MTIILPSRPKREYNSHTALTLMTIILPSRPTRSFLLSVSLSTFPLPFPASFRNASSDLCCPISDQCIGTIIFGSRDTASSCALAGVNTPSPPTGTNSTSISSILSRASCESSVSESAPRCTSIISSSCTLYIVFTYSATVPCEVFDEVGYLLCERNPCITTPPLSYSPGPVTAKGLFSPYDTSSMPFISGLLRETSAISAPKRTAGNSEPLLIGSKTSVSSPKVTLKHCAP